MKKIIIVEDEFRIRNGLSTLINKLDMGCKVIGEAENGFEGLKMISDMEPEVVITDIKMPKMDGLSMIRQAKEMGASCDFIILSGYAEFEYAQQGIQLGVMDYLLKPASVSDVKELLNKLNEEKEITQGLDRENCSDIVREMISCLRRNRSPAFIAMERRCRPCSRRYYASRQRRLCFDGRFPRKESPGDLPYCKR